MNGKLSVKDLCEKIDGAEIIQEDDPSVLKNHPDGVLLFMGAGDIQKVQAAYENIITN